MFQTDIFPAAQSRRPGGPVRRPGPTLCEVFPAPGSEAAAAGFVLAQLGRGAAPVLWIQDRLAQSETGRPYLAGLGLDRPLLVMRLSRPADVMAAIEEGLRCRALGAVVAELHGNPPAASFTASKRLALRAGAAGVPCWLIRQAATPDLSAARDRWRVATLPSAPDPDDPQAPGDPCWRVELFRSRDRPPGAWVARHERGHERGHERWTSDRLDLVAAFPDGAVAEAAGPDRRRGAR